MGQRIVQVDAFTDRPFAGNPAAVCLLAEPRDERWMQLVAREMNLSETAFLLPEGDGYRLRWFTPTVEVDLCGHATLASAHILWEEGLLRPDDLARFYTRSGLLTARCLDSWIELDFPATPATATTPPPGLSEALGVTPLLVARNQFDYLVELESEEAVRTLQPDLTRLLTIPARGFIVTSRASGQDYDFVSRFFGPAVGVNEDPVTGSAHCTLAPFWCSRLGRPALTGYQASARGGLVRVRLAGERVFLSGQAVTVLRAECFF
ncbi:MAG: PhzF family phenazine biosynthesis protein [Thermogemmatispora sp.]|uniref:PhzF family phenazine biosynthesis protein n=1 Tax=Thermogemmatispora sp. TaxID=1968838 RepID=UPI00261210F1|nr:PhzF family phenazine biosynthesis protein [Thermogemmatispora sp.]MBX5455947.1 PhzF family phenazine biosynthesis protein [Thermogemmatispora sp.]